MSELHKGAAAIGASSTPYAVRLKALTKSYGKGDGAVTALAGVSHDFRRRSFTAVMGPSGSGKSTLMHCAAGLDRPSSGTVHLGGIDLSAMDETHRTKLRREQVGFVFQAFNLIPSLNVAQNVALPLRLAGRRGERARVREVLGQVGLADRAGHRPAHLSGGQQQRVAIARALVTRPEVIFADEPTGALDISTSREVLGLLRQVVDELGQTVVMVTHDPMAAAWADEVFFLVDGRIVDELVQPTPARVAERMTRLER